MLLINLGGGELFQQGEMWLGIPGQRGLIWLKKKKNVQTVSYIAVSL